MNPLLEKIKELLMHSFFLSESIQNEVLQSLPTLSEKALQELLLVLKEADTKQYDFLQSAVENNPSLVDELEGIYQKVEASDNIQKESNLLLDTLKKSISHG